ncbi:MAG: hypothetical protein PHE54_05565 [Bacilli bacterium]|nr:hypothetical protein [Bacilli bacterium]
MKNNIVNLNFEKKKILTGHLISTIDVNNNDLVKSLISYVNKVDEKSLIRLIYRQPEKRQMFIFGCINSNIETLLNGLYDIAFLVEDNRVIGHIIKHIQIERYDNCHFKMIMSSYEENIPSVYQSNSLYQAYYDKRFRSVIDSLNRGKQK